MGETMIERVARAQWARSERPESWETVDPKIRELCLDHARAAVEAMREEDLRLELAWRKFGTQYRVAEDGCWVWAGAVDRRDGYGRFYDGSGNTIGAHQFAYRYCRGEVPPGHVIDHKCRNRRCVNPDHLRAVTNSENVLCGKGITAEFARAQYCGRGHSLRNAYVRPNGQRQCRDCQRQREKAYKTKRRTVLSESPSLGDGR